MMRLIRAFVADALEEVEGHAWWESKRVTDNIIRDLLSKPDAARSSVLGWMKKRLPAFGPTAVMPPVTPILGPDVNAFIVSPD